MHDWQAFLSLAHVVQISVFLNRMPLPGFQRNTVNGRAQISHSWPRCCFDMRTYGLGPKHDSHRIGVSASAEPALAAPCLFRKPYD